MKAIKSYIRNAAMALSIGAMGLGSVSCDSMLDTKPQGTFSADQIGEEEAVDLMTAAYATLLCHYFGNNESFAGPINNWVIDLRSDDALKGGEALTMEEYMHQLEIGNVQSDNAVINFKWRNNYYSISRCNTAIQAFKQSASLSNEQKASLIGEMKTLRAYYYFDMYRLFEKFPYFTEEDADPSAIRADKYTRAEMMSFIKQDLADSYEVMPETQEQAGRFNKYVAAAILARVALFDSDWETVEKYSDYVIKSGQYSLYPNFLDMSKPEYNNMYESVMAVQFTSANSPEQYNFNNCLNCTSSEFGIYGNGDDFYIGSQDLINAFRTNAQGLPYLDGSYNSENIDAADYTGNVDPRLDFTFGRIGMPWRAPRLNDPTYTYNEKWCLNLNLYGQYSCKKPFTSPESPYCKPGIVPWGASSLNYVIIRYADVLLMKAEALIEQNKNIDDARLLINEVRAKAARSIDADYTPIDINPMLANYEIGEYPAAGWNQDYARKAVRMERRLELAMEGLRWFDLLRWGNVNETLTNYFRFEVQFQPYYSNAVVPMNSLYFPIPLEQVDNAGDLYK